MVDFRFPIPYKTGTVNLTPGSPNVNLARGLSFIHVNQWGFLFIHYFFGNKHYGVTLHN